jgi:RHS repeat-associated protein
MLAAHRAYDAGGRLTETVYGNGLTEHRDYIVGENLPARIATPGMASPAPITEFAYSYDAGKRMLTQSDGAQPAAGQQFAYDAEGRLIGWHGGPSTQTWDLSPVGDWLSTSRDGLTEARTHTPVHEIRTIDRAPVLSDAKGNLVVLISPIQLYGWDDENRLARAAGLGHHGLFAATYRYDALGRRVQKRVNGETTTWISAGAQEVVEIVGDPAHAPWLDPHADLSPPVTGTGPRGSLLQQAGALHVDFRPDAAGAEQGWLPDTGDLAAPGAVPPHGWDRNRPAIDRDWLGQPEWDTFVRMMPGSSVGAWSIALADGSYPLVIVMGDATSRDQTNTITVNDVRLDDPTPAERGPNGYEQGAFDGYTTQVTVTSGRLTIAPVRGAARDPKLCFVEIGPRGGAIDAATSERVAATVKRMTAATASRRGKPAAATETVYAAYVDEPVMEVEQGKQRYVHANRLYSVAAFTDAAGLALERYRYDAYGRRTVSSGSGAPLPASAIDADWGFTGRKHEPETGLLSMRARHLSPSLGRFLSRDPSQYVDGLSMYGAYFVPNGLDPTGHEDSPPPPPAPCPCICVTEPAKCSITVAWENSGFKGASRGADYYPKNKKNNYQLKFQQPATVTLVHSDGKSTAGCHLRQDTEGHATWEAGPGAKKDWKTPEDYSSTASAKNTLYKGNSFEDMPGVVKGWDDNPGDQGIWWQAHVYVEEATTVETWWGYSGSATWDKDNKPGFGYDRWSGGKREQSFPKAGTDAAK